MGAHPKLFTNLRRLLSALDTHHVPNIVYDEWVESTYNCDQNCNNFDHP